MTRVGELRPSQLLHTYGVGATVELPEITAMVLGLDEWPRRLGEPISEPRLLAAVRAVVGQQLQQLVTPPLVPEGDTLGVPVAPFPRWLRCPVCGLLAPIEHGIFQLREDRYRPDRTAYVHEGCPRSRSRRPPHAFPARYLTACHDGHIDDFPWVEFLHGPIECKGTLRMREFGEGGRAGDVQVSCDECGRRRRLSQAFGDDARTFLPPTCRGRHPHLGVNHECDNEPVTLLLGASNTWFPVQSSALSIPSQAGELSTAIDDAWDVLGAFPPDTEKPMFEITLATNPLLAPVREVSERVGVDTVYEAFVRRHTGNGGGDPKDLRTPEWRVFTAVDTAPESPEFKLRQVAVPLGFENSIDDVVLVERLREVSALRGFTRISAPDDQASRGGKVVGLTRQSPTWLPCSEVRGEGIFLRLPEEAVREWEARYRPSGPARALRDGQRGWRARRSLSDDPMAWLGERYVLLHSLSHALIRELALECGYNASSIRERIYATDPHGASDAMAGILLYTAAPDSEGTLGGLVSLGEPDQLGPLLRQALERGQLCSSDPLCAEHDPRSDSSIHAAACHACQFASETSCEQGNRFLDRSTIAPTLGHDSLAYFRLT